MNDSSSYAQGSRCFEELRAMDDMNEFGSWAQGSKCNEQLSVVDDMNDLGSRELKELDVVNNLGLWMIWTIQGHQLKP